MRTLRHTLYKIRACINVCILKIGYQLTHTDTFDLYDVRVKFIFYYIVYNFIMGNRHQK